MRIAALLIFLALGSHAKAAEPIPQKKIPADKSFTIKTRYVLITMPTIRFENFDKFQERKASLEIFPGILLSKNDVRLIDTPDRTQNIAVLNRSISYRGMTLKRNCSLLLSSPTKSGTNPVRVLERVNCARSEIEIDGTSLSTSFADHMGVKKGEFGANFDIILRSKLVTEDGRILHPGNVIRLTEWIDDAETNEVELVAEKPSGPIVPDDYL